MKTKLELLQKLFGKAMKKPGLLFLFVMLLGTGSFTQNVGINDDNSDPHPSAGLDVKFNNKGFLPPRMTRQQRNAITGPANGLMVFCTDCAANGALCIYIYDKWMTMTYCHSEATTAEFNIPGNDHITWKWNAVAGAKGYKWSASNNYSTVTDMGTSTSKLETGLVAGQTYARHVWAYNIDCGESDPTTLSQSTLNIGMSYRGGIIFHIDNSVEHGLIAATANQSTAAMFCCYGGYLECRCSNTAISMGQANTNAIINGCKGFNSSGPTNS